MIERPRDEVAVQSNRCTACLFVGVHAILTDVNATWVMDRIRGVGAEPKIPKVTDEWFSDNWHKSNTNYQDTVNSVELMYQFRISFY